MVYSTDMYPVQLDVDYPEESRNRLTTLIRLIMVIPIAFIIYLISFSLASETASAETAPFDDPLWAIPLGILLSLPIAAMAGTFLVTLGMSLATALMILFRKKYPRWWFDFQLELHRFSMRIGAYVLLLRDEYPSTDEEQAVHLDIAYPDAQGQLNRIMPLIKWILAIPHYIVLYLLWILAVVASIIAWFSILIVGRYPRGMFDFVVGVNRWTLRVAGYAFVLVSDRYPPFRLSE